MPIPKPALLAIAVIVAIAAFVAVYSARRAGPSSPVPRDAAVAKPVVPAVVSGAKTNADDVFMADKVEVTSEDVAYFGTTKGLYAHPREAGSYPGVVMIHEWWGLNDGIRAMAKRLAGQGFAVLAVDLYDGKVAKTADEATALVKGIDQDRADGNMRAAADFLRARGSAKIASLGWCFGGGQSLRMALDGKLDATVLYYGTPLVTDKARLKAIAWPVLGIFGDQDQAIPTERVRAFDEALTELGVAHDVRLYPGVGHAFANPSGPNFAPDKTRDAWLRTVDFLDKNLK